MSRAYKFEYITLLLEQISENQNRIGNLITDAVSAEPLEAVKPEIDKITARNKTLLRLAATLIEEVKEYPSGMVPPSPVRFY